SGTTATRGQRRRLRRHRSDGHPGGVGAATDTRHRRAPARSDRSGDRQVKERAMSATKTEYKAFIGGEWADSASGETMDVINPATGEVVAEVPRCGAEDVDRAVEAAKRALPDWLDKTPKDRSELLHALADVLTEHAEEL